MSDINANIVVTQNEITITATNDEIVITPNPLNMNIFTNDSAPGGFPGDLQYNANGLLGGIPTANYISGNLSLGNSTNLKITGGSNAYFLQTDGTGNLTWAPGTANVSGNGTSAGANNQIQLTDGSGNFKSAPGFTLDTASNLFSAPGNAYFESNVTADYYFGNGAFLTGIDTSQISNGNSNVKVLLNGPILISSNGNSNTMSITDSVINIEPETVINQSLTLKKDNVGSDLLFIESYNNSNTQINGIETRRYRGNTGTPLTVQNGDEIYSIDHRAQYTNGSFNQSTLAGSNTIVTAVNANGNMSVNTTMYANYTNSNLILDYSNIAANGNITANLFTGNGSGLSALTGANVTGQVANALIAGTVYTNAQPNITSVGTLSSLTVTGNISAGNITSNNLTVNLELAGNTANFTGNISANYFIGNGSQLTGIDTSLISNGNSNVRTFANSNVTISSNGVANVVVVTDTDMFITGNANVTSNLSANAVKTDNLQYANGTPYDFEQPGGSNTNIQFNDSDDFGGSNAFTFDKSSNTVILTGNITTNNANLGNLIIANYLQGILTTNAQPNITSVGTLSNLSVTGNINAGNVSGTLLTGTLTTNAQPNITSVGNLTRANVTGNIVANNYLWYNTGLTPLPVITGADGNFNQLRTYEQKIALGLNAGLNSGNTSVAIGTSAGRDTQGSHSIAIGNFAGNYLQGSHSIAIGNSAGRNNQGNFTIAIGSGAGVGIQHDNTIILNATGLNLFSQTANALFIKPIRTVNSTAGLNQLYYNSTTGEIVYYQP